MIRKLLRQWLGVDDCAGRVTDIERHFVTKRDEHGQPVETLADVPLSQRKPYKPSMAGLSWPQRRALLEMTEGGTVPLRRSAEK